MTLNNFYAGKKIWITGSTSGIGLALSKKILELGGFVFLSGRNDTEINVLLKKYPDRSRKILFDVDGFNNFLEAGHILKKHTDYIDIVIFNAGTNQYLDKDKFDHKIFEHLIKTNFLSIVYGIEIILPFLKKSNSPQLVCMSSQVGLLGLPRAEAYCASKSAIHTMMQGFAASYYKKISTTTIYPGFVKTPLTDLNKFHMPFLMSSSKAAKIIIKGIARKKTVIRFPKRLTFIIFLANIIPKKILLFITSKMV
ncbi:MAG: SDR family NAD(P)-dependent oxidoreductase [Legionellales bacterium]|nr:SDR family NAD(P)-dependent oxidoreductase [Legionellales bacterium]